MEQTVSFHAKTGTGRTGNLRRWSKPLVFMQKQKPETENSQKGKKSWGGPGPGSGQDLARIWSGPDFHPGIGGWKGWQSREIQGEIYWIGWGRCCYCYSYCYCYCTMIILTGWHGTSTVIVSFHAKNRNLTNLRNLSHAQGGEQTLGIHAKTAIWAT